MLLNKKLLMGICNALAILLVLAFLISIVMYVWAYFGTPILPIYNVQNGVISYYVFVSSLATYLFLYMVVGASAAMIKGSKLNEGLRK